MYTSGQIINKEEHIKFASWNNVNGGKMYSVSLGNGMYRLEALKTPTEDELKQVKRNERNYLLRQTDKYMISDFPITEEEKERYKAYRQYLRDIPEQQNFPNMEIKTFEEYNQ